MATVTRRVEAPVERVYTVLADGWTYAGWVVGTSHIRAVDAHWPAPGSKIYHASGPWPLVVRDYTEMTDVDPDAIDALFAVGG